MVENDFGIPLDAIVEVQTQQQSGNWTTEIRSGFTDPAEENPGLFMVKSILAHLAPGSEDQISERLEPESIDRATSQATTTGDVTLDDGFQVTRRVDSTLRSTHYKDKNLLKVEVQQDFIMEDNVAEGSILSQGIRQEGQPDEITTEVRARSFSPDGAVIAKFGQDGTLTEPPTIFLGADRRMVESGLGKSQIQSLSTRILQDALGIDDFSAFRLLQGPTQRRMIQAGQLGQPAAPKEVLVFARTVGSINGPNGR